MTAIVEDIREIITDETLDIVCKQEELEERVKKIELFLSSNYIDFEIENEKEE